MRARPLEFVSCSPSQRMPIGAHKLSLLTRKRKTHTNSRTVQHAVGVCKYKCVDGLGTANGVPYGTLYFMAACPKIGASALPAVPAVTKQEGGSRACVIATGLWVPLRFHSVAPKIPSVFCSVCLAVLSSSYPNGWESGLRSTWPEITALRDAEAYWSSAEFPGCLTWGLSVCLTDCLTVCVHRRGEEGVVRASC